MQAPKYWYPKRKDTVPLEARALWPFALLYRLGARMRRMMTKPEAGDVPIICVGNLTLGGTGKTPTVAALALMLKEMGRKPMILSRGHGGASKGPLRVDPELHSAAEVGDEPLLLSRVAPVIVARDRPAGAQLAAEEGADVILMDDGFQNPTIVKDFSIVVVDGRRFFGNGQVFPAGPLRERVRKGLARADALLIMGGDPSLPLPPELEAFEGPTFRATLKPQVEPALLDGVKVLAFAGIGSPAKFFRTVKALGARVMGEVSFPDHHPYTESDLRNLKRRAQDLEADLVTTEKDTVRLPPGAENISAIPIKAIFANRSAVTDLLGNWLAGAPEGLKENETSEKPLLVRVSDEKRVVKLQHYIEAAVFFSLMGFFRVLGLRRASAFGGWVARTFGPHVSAAARARRNLRLAMPELSKKQRERVIKRMFENLGRTMAEYAHLDRFTSVGDGAHIEIVGEEIFEKVQVQDKGALLVSGHFANWELMPLVLRERGGKGAEVYRAPNNPFIDDWMIKQRATHIFPVQIPKGAEGGRALLKVIRGGDYVAMLVDQKMNEGIPVPFFGHEAMTPPAAAALSLRYKVPIVPARLERVGGTKFRLIVTEPPSLPSTGDTNMDIYNLTVWLNEYLEQAIRANPSQWLWLHQRWGKYKNGKLERPKGVSEQAA